jgi:hypothetical protein
MTPLAPIDRLEPTLRDYLRRHFLVLPCAWQPDDRHPLITGGFYNASNDVVLVVSWWARWPPALVAVRTGKRPQGSGLAIVDVDPRHDGFSTLARLVGPEIPKVPQVHTPSGGLHLWYLSPPNGCFSVDGIGGKQHRGLGLGLDFKCNLRQCHAPGGSPRSPYRWDERYNLHTCPLLPLPAALTPIEIPEDAEDPATVKPQRPIGNANAYAEAAVNNACERIRTAPCGVQRHTLNAEAFAIGRLAGALPDLDHAWVIHQLIEAGMAMANQGGRAPWLRHQVRDIVVSAFRDGLRRPRAPQLRTQRRR